MILRIDNYVPRPKQRPRLGKQGNVYSPSSIEEKNLGKIIRYMANEEFSDDIYVGLQIITEKRLRGDIDNYEKFIYDALQKSKIIRNDSQIRSKKTDLYHGRDCLIIEIKDLFDSLGDREKIQILRRKGHSIREISKKVNVSKSHVHRVISIMSR